MGKMLVPIFPEEGDGYRWFPHDRTAVHIEKEDLPKVQRTVADQGRYSAVMTPEEWRRMNGNSEAMNALFTDLAHERVRAAHSSGTSRAAQWYLAQSGAFGANPFTVAGSSNAPAVGKAGAAQAAGRNAHRNRRLDA